MDKYIVVLCLLICFIYAVSSTSCPQGHFGPSCSGVCHCDSVDACSPHDGQCTTGFCSRGWTSFPHCQQPCPDGTFGLNCERICHCPVGDECAKVNGLCSSGTCEYGWSGPSCQRRLPMFTCPVNITTVTPSSITVTWRRWSPTFDVGSGPIVYYLLEYQQKGHDWKEVSSRVETMTGDFFVHVITPLQANTPYRFRLTLGYQVADKWLRSIPGMATGWKWTKPAQGMQIMVTTSTTMAPTTTTTATSTSFSSSMAPTTASITTAASSKASTNGSQSLAPIQGTTTQSPVASSTTTTQYVPEVRGLVLELQSRSSDSLALSWRSSDGCSLQWSSYAVSLTEIDTFNTSSSRAPVHQTTETTASLITLSHLPPATLFSVSVTPLHPADPGCASRGGSRGFWTEPLPPPQPLQPEFISATDSTIELKLFGADQPSELLTYQILIEDLTSSNGTLLALLSEIDLMALWELVQSTNGNNNDKTQEVNNIYITAELSAERLSPDGTAFVIGDNEVYGSYHNRPLQADHEYKVWISNVVRLDGVEKRTISQSPFTVTPSEGKASFIKYVQGNSNKTVLAASLSVFFILALAAGASGLAYFLWQRKKKNESSHLYDDIMTYHRGKTLYDKYKAKEKERALKYTRNDIHHNHLWTSTPNPTVHHPPRKLKPSLDSIDLEISGPEIRIPKTPGVPMQESYCAIKKSNPISVPDLRKYCLERENSDYSLAEEFRHLPLGMLDTIFEALKPENMMLNRTSQVLPYDKNRIRLKSIIPDDEPDYINASLVKTHIHTFYIVTQCPLETTLGEFWRLVWDEMVTLVVALMDLHEDGKPEFEQYWPTLEEGAKFYHDISVSCISTERTAHYSIRKFQLSRLIDGEEELRYVTQYQYVSWTKGGVPTFTAPFLDFVDRIRENQRQQPRQPQTCLVQCHTGSGRSGMYIALDSLIDEGESTGKVDVLKCVTNLRLERPNLVKRQKQYNFVYTCLMEYFMYHNTNIHASSFGPMYENILNVNMNNARSLLALEYEALDVNSHNRHSALDRRGSIIKDFSLFVSPVLKRASFNMGGDSLEHVLRPNMSDPDCSNKLIVAYPDSYLQKGAFIISKFPKPGQVDSFWSEVIEHGCQAVVALTGEDFQQGAMYYPEEGKDTFTDQHIIYCKTPRDEACANSRFAIQDITLQKLDGGQGKGLTVRHFSFPHWPGHQDAPSVTAMVRFIHTVQAWKRTVSGTRPLLVMSDRSQGRAALLCLAWNLLERIEAEGVVNVFRSVRHGRNLVPTVVNCATQYKFLYQCVKVHLQSQEAVETAKQSSYGLCSSLDEGSKEEEEEDTRPEEQLPRPGEPKLSWDLSGPLDGSSEEEEEDETKQDGDNSTKEQYERQGHSDMAVVDIDIEDSQNITDH